MVPGLCVLERVRAPPTSFSLVPIPVSFPLSLSCLRVLAREASPSWREQQDTRQETALDISLSYIYKVSHMAVSMPCPGQLREFPQAWHHCKHCMGCQH